MTKLNAVQILNANKEQFTVNEIHLIKALWSRQEYASVSDICSLTGINERDLRGKEEEDGIRLSASKKLFELTGYKIISRTQHPSGIKITDDSIEWELAAKQMRAHSFSALKNAQHYEETVQQRDQRKEKELTLEFTNSAP